MERLIRLPVHLGASFSVIRATEQQLRIDLGRPPTDDELLECLSGHKNHKVLRNACRTFHIPTAQGTSSLDAEFQHKDGEEDGSLYTVLADEKVVDPAKYTLQQGQKQLLNQLLDALDTRGQTVMKLLWGLDGEAARTFKEVGDQLGISPERVRQIHSKDIGKLRAKAIRAGISMYDLL